jgi:hypothetical protein
MLFKRDGAHGLDAPLPPDITLKPGFPGKTPMLEANGGVFPSDPEALPNDWLGADLCVATIGSGRRSVKPARLTHVYRVVAATELLDLRKLARQITGKIKFSPTD